MTNGEVIITPAWLEPEGGFGAAGVQVRVDGAGRVTGTKRHVQFASAADRLLAQDGVFSKAVAGSQSLGPMLNLRLAQPDLLVDITSIPAGQMRVVEWQGKPVWIGQISRDIGVRFTMKTWNLTTHKIDPDVDDARDYVIDDLMESGRVSHVAQVPGAGAAPRETPRHNLTGDPYFTDGMRAVAVFSDTRTTPILLDWE